MQDELWSVPLLKNDGIVFNKGLKTTFESHYNYDVVRSQNDISILLMG